MHQNDYNSSMLNLGHHNENMQNLARLRYRVMDRNYISLDVRLSKAMYIKSRSSYNTARDFFSKEYKNMVEYKS